MVETFDNKNFRCHIRIQREKLPQNPYCMSHYSWFFFQNIDKIFKNPTSDALDFVKSALLGAFRLYNIFERYKLSDKLVF